MATRLFRAFGALLIATALLLTASAPVVAQEEDKARAIQLIEQANTAYDAGEFRSSLRLYRQVYRLTEDPRVLYRIGLNYENLSNYQRAREHLELFLLAEPDSKYAGRVKAKIASLRDLEASLQAAVQVETFPPGAQVWIDEVEGPPVGVTPVRIPVGVGPVELLIRKEGHDDVRDEFTVESGETLQKTYELSGEGVPVTSEDPDVETTTVSASTPPEEVDATVFTGQPTRVRIGPSPAVAALCWVAVGAGWVLTAAGLVVSQTTGAPIGGGAVGAGLALFGVGGYFLWIRDWTRHLPPAAAATLTPPPVHAAGFSVRF